MNPAGVDIKTLYENSPFGNDKRLAKSKSAALTIPSLN